MLGWSIILIKLSLNSPVSLPALSAHFFHQEATLNFLEFAEEEEWQYK